MTKCQLAYSHLFKEHLSTKTLDDIRDATNKALPLGSTKFKHKVEKLTKRRAMLKAKGRPNKVESDPN